MRFEFGTKHNTIGLSDYRKESGINGLENLKMTHPNIMAATKEFMDDWRAREMPNVHHKLLVVTLLIDHCGGMFTNKKQKLAKTKTGYSAVIAMTQAELFDGTRERPIKEIVATLDDKMMEIIRRPTFSRKVP